MKKLLSQTSIKPKNCKTKHNSTQIYSTFTFTRTTTLLFISCIYFLFLSCQKEIGNANSNKQKGFGNKGQIYLSMNLVDTLLTSPFNMTYPNFAPGYKAMKHATVCYDIENDTAIWTKIDTMFVTSPYPMDGIGFVKSGSQYHRNFKIGNYLIRILAKEELAPVGGAEYLYPNGVHTGIYLEKRDIHNGAIILMKMLIPPGEFSTGVNHDKFTLTNIINIGNKFYFGTNNNSLYCYDENGILVWKKTNFNPRISGTSPQMGYLYNSSDKLSYLSSDGKLKLVDALTGNTLWSVDCTPYQESFEVLITNKYVFTFSRDFVLRFRIQDGFNGFDDYIPTQVFTGGPSLPNIQPFSAIVNDSSVCFWADRDRLLSIGGEVTQVNGVANVNFPMYGKYLTKYPNSFFYITHNMTTGIPESLIRIDFRIFNGIVWENRFTGQPVINDWFTVQDLITDDNNLYLLSHSNLNGYNFIPSNIAKRFGNSLYLYSINPANGNIVSKGVIFSNPQYSIQQVFAVTYADN